MIQISAPGAYPILFLTLIVALFCLTPIFILNSGLLHISDGEVNRERFYDSIYYTAPLLGSLFVAIIPAIDLLLDMPLKFVNYVLPDERYTKKMVESKVVRLTECERMTFILGLIVQSVSVLWPDSSSPFRISIVCPSSTNASILLTLIPIVTFLERTTTTFTPSWTFAIAFLGLVAFVLKTIPMLLNEGNSHITALRLAEAALSSASGLIYLCIIILCFIKFLSTKFITAASRLETYNSIKKYIVQPMLLIRHEDASADDDGDLYTNYIPALHMVSSVIISLAYTSVTLSPEPFKLMMIARKNYVVLAAEILVLVIELRIRKNELARGLIALLESKKSYVRYISHELRTPLNTAFLGLKLLTNELKISNSPRDVDRYDTLCDVNMSCMAAVDILNDLLCHEKLESGILELHKEHITVVPFLNDCISMFSVQAREGEVALTVETELNGSKKCCGYSDPSQVTLSLENYDTVYCDKFKMDQVIRNIISNALKFTPRGGAVTVSASFVHESKEHVERYCADSDVANSSVNKNPNKSENLKSNEKSNSKINEKSNTKSNSKSYVKVSAKSSPAKSPSRSNDSVVRVAQQSYENARKRNSFRPFQSNPKPNPCFAADPLNGKLVIVVTDNGVGISKQNQERLFKEVVQFSPEKLQSGGGSGLGMWITGGIMSLHDGSIHVHSDGEGTGTSFIVEMPMRRTPRSIDQNKTARQSNGSGINIPFLELTGRSRSLPVLSNSSFTDTSPPLPRKPKYSLLVVDDSRLNRKMLVKCLTADGHVCFESADGLEAISVVKERMDYANGGHAQPFDAILMDFIMPNMDGPTATKEIRDLGYKAPIFGVTGNGLPLDISHFMACGANKVLIKPLDISLFASAMKEL